MRGSTRQADDVDVDRRPSHGRVDEERVRPSVGVLFGTPLGTLRDRRRRRGEAHQRHFERLRDGGDRFDLRRGRRVVHRHDESPEVVRASSTAATKRERGDARHRRRELSRVDERHAIRPGAVHGDGFPLPRFAHDAQEPVPKLAASVQDAASDDVRLERPGPRGAKDETFGVRGGFPNAGDVPATGFVKLGEDAVRVGRGCGGPRARGRDDDERSRTEVISRGALEKRHRGLDLGVILGEGHHHDVRAEQAQVFVLLVSLRSREREW